MRLRNEFVRKLTSIVRQVVFGKQRWSYWKFLLAAATRYRGCFGMAMTLAVMGYHFQVLTLRLSEAVEAPAHSPAIQKELRVKTVKDKTAVH